MIWEEKIPKSKLCVGKISGSYGRGNHHKATLRIHKVGPESMQQNWGRIAKNEQGQTNSTRASVSND
jgi:hypothetical protein